MKKFFESLTASNNRLTKERAESVMTDIAQALEGYHDAYWVTWEVGTPPFLKFIPRGADIRECLEEQYCNTRIIPPGVVSGKLSEEELWAEFEKLTHVA